jgi:hypothetical protein
MKFEKPQLHMQLDSSTCGFLTADARILRADNGSEIAVGELVRNGERSGGVVA